MSPGTYNKLCFLTLELSLVPLINDKIGILENKCMYNMKIQIILENKFQKELGSMKYFKKENQT